MFGFFNEIGIIAQLSGNAFEKVMTGGMTLSQFSVLNHLARLGGNRTPLQIARAMQVTKGTMTNTLGHLERARHISVRPDERDGRSKRVDITPSGLAARNAAIAALMPELGFLAERISLEDMAAAMPLLEQVRKILDERRN
ncbi:MAG: MarR family transcriptional regulator [Brucellaceae bacterium]|nr:MarR family transcriptional regulator [Brucellaceae bacterium]